MLEQEIVGQETLISTLKYSVKKNQVPHAQLFIDRDGYGGLALALFQAVLLLYEPEALNKALEQKKQLADLALHPDLHFLYPTINIGSNTKSNVQELLPHWQRFIKEKPYGNHSDWMDLLEAGNKQAQIGVKEMASMQERLSLKSYEGNAKICIIWGAEKINLASANKFLKTLEEPPQHTFFFLLSATTELLPTIISRCQSLILPPISKKALVKAIEDRQWDAALVQDLNQCKGSYRTLLNRATEAMVKPFEEMLIRLLRCAFAAKGNKKIVLDLLAWVDDVVGFDKEDQKEFLSYSVEVLRDAFMLNYALDELTSFRSKTGFNLSKLAPFVHHLNLSALVSLFEDSHFYIGRNANAKMIFTDLSLQLTRLIHTKGESDLPKTKKLEE